MAEEKVTLYATEIVLKENAELTSDTRRAIIASLLPCCGILVERTESGLAVYVGQEGRDAIWANGGPYSIVKAIREAGNEA